MGKLKAHALSADKPANPVTLSDLSQEGLAVFCWCNRCSHHAEVPTAPLIEKLGAFYPVPELGQVMRCSQCQTGDITTRPAWPAYGGQMARHG
ncbi:MAG: hypothetical protein ACON4F_00265 [Candidatus Puniceispirillaceae bacterium]